MKKPSRNTLRLRLKISAFVYLYRRLRLNESEEASLPMLSAVWEPNEIWREFISCALRASYNPSFKRAGCLRFAPVTPQLEH